MNFSDLLNQYMDLLKCSAKELATASGLSGSIISRYRRGEREPRYQSDTTEKLIMGIASLARKRGMTQLEEKDIRHKIQSALNSENVNYELFALRFDQLINTLDISLVSLSAFLAYDTSFLSRVRSGKRHPSDVHIFAEKVAEYLLLHYVETEERRKLALLMDDIAEEGDSRDALLREHIIDWLCPVYVEDVSSEDLDHVNQFLTKLEDFNLEEYIRSIHFDELKVPTAPFQFPHSKEYQGVAGFKQMHIDMAKATVLSRSKEPVYFYSDLPIEEVGQDKDFARKWMFALALMLRKNLHIHMLHNVNRPLPEMLMGLEGWIPLYMTGLVHPYYLPTPPRIQTCVLSLELPLRRVRG